MMRNTFHGDPRPSLHVHGDAEHKQPEANSSLMVPSGSENFIAKA